LIACYDGHEEIVKILLNYKADINIKDSWGKTALDIARERRRFKIVELLMDYKKKHNEKKRFNRSDEKPRK
jgi:ankyrin repeat protein